MTNRDYAIYCGQDVLHALLTGALAGLLAGILAGWVAGRRG